MSNQGIYAGLINTKPNRDRVIRPQVIVDTDSLWVIEYQVKGVGKGCAVCKAPNPLKAERLLKRDGRYSSLTYEILCIKEIITSPTSMLVAEQSITYKEVSNEL